MKFMTVIAKTTATFVCLWIINFSVLAEKSQTVPSNPSMTSKDYFSDDDKPTSLNLEIKRLDISVSLNNAYAETHILVDFYNPSKKRLEGDFIMDMPHASIVTGYGLDIDGRLVEGVIVEKEAAKKVFEERIRQGIDPGLAEATRENAFKTRVFPIDKNQTRTISLSFVSPISESRPYVLPLVSDESIENFKLDVSNNAIDEAPLVQLPSGLTFTWESKNKVSGQIVNSVSKKNVLLSGELNITPKTLRTHSIERHRNGQRFLAVTLPANSVTKKTIKAPKTVRVYWDSSLSHLSTAKKELSFINRALASFKSAEIEVIQFSGAPTQKNQPSTDLKKISNRLQKVIYHGATNLETLFASQIKRSAVDLCLLVSDGHNTLGKFPLQTMPCPLFTVSAATDADSSGLNLLAKYGGGQFVDLRAMSISEGIKALSSNVQRLLGLELNDRNEITDAEWNTDGDRFRLIVPIKDGDNKLGLAFESSVFDIEFRLDDIQEGQSHSAFWAQQNIATERAKGSSRSELVTLSQTYSVAARETSFLVLETVEDYVENGIRLPEESFDKKQHAEYAELLSEKGQKERDAKSKRMENVISQWAEQIVWFNTKFEFKPKKIRQNISRELTDSSPSLSRRQSRPIIVQEAAQSPAPEPVATSITTNKLMQEVIVTGTITHGSDYNNIDSIKIKAWSPNRAYLKSMKGLCGKPFMRSYFKQRTKHGTLPSFYLEMADVLANCKDFNNAINIALSALELPAANQDTTTAVAQRLMNFNSYETAVELFRQVTVLEPQSPHSWRNLALALEQQADSKNLNNGLRLILYKEALTLLNHIIENPWDEDYDGIEMIAVMEANLLVKKIESVGGRNKILNKRLQRLLDVDLRVLLTWNADQVDVDLWVDEPTKERVSYSNNLSGIGGKISNDMTNGYGPEEYLIKNAISGDYKIKVDYFGSDIINPNGAVIVRVHIFRNWGRENQTVEVADLEFTDQEQKAYRVAKVRIK